MLSAVVSQLLSSPSYVSEAILHLKGYRFYGVHEEDFSLFILYDCTRMRTWGKQTRGGRNSGPGCAASSHSLCVRVRVCALCVALSYTENVGVSSLAAHNKEILENVLRHNGGLITAE